MEWNTVERAIDRNRHKNRIKRSGQARLVYVKDINRNVPATWRRARGDMKAGRPTVAAWCATHLEFLMCQRDTGHLHSPLQIKLNIPMTPLCHSPLFIILSACAMAILPSSLQMAPVFLVTSCIRSFTADVCDWWRTTSRIVSKHRKAMRRFSDRLVVQVYTHAISRKQKVQLSAIKQELTRQAK